MQRLYQDRYLQAKVLSMKVIILILIAFLLTSCSGKAYKKGTSNSEFVEVYEEPRHQLVFDHNDFKILDIQIKPGDTTLFHRHKYPMFYVSLGWQESASQLLNAKWIEGDSEEWPSGEMDIDSSYLTNPIIHRVTNKGLKTSRVIGILNTGYGLNISESKENNNYNRWFRSKKIELKPNDTLIFRKLEFPTIGVFASNGKVKIMKNNRSHLLNKNWYLIEDNSMLINSSDSKIEFIQVEVLNNKASR